MKIIPPQTSRAPDLVRPRIRKFSLRLLLVLLFAASGGGALAQTAKWEYCVRSVKLQNRILEQMLNDYAAQGWELVQIERGVAIFKLKRARR